MSKITRGALFLALVALHSPLLFGQQPQTSNAPVFSANAKYVQGMGPGFWPTIGAGLTLNLAAGTAVCGPIPAIVNYPGGTLAMAANQTNYVYLDPWADCAPASNTTGFVVGHIPVAKVVTDNSSITGITDARGWFQPSPCTIGGGGSVDCRPGIFNGFAWMFVTGVGAATKPILALYNDTTGWVYGDIEAETETNGMLIYGSGNVTIRAEGAVDMKPGATASVVTARLDNIRFASQFPGADWAAKVNAADNDIGGVPGVIYVSSSLAGTATTTLTPSANKKIVFMGGTFTSTASPNININASGVVLEGSGDGVAGIGTTFQNDGTGDAIVIGDGTSSRRGITLRDFRVLGNASGGDGIELQANVGNSRFENIFIDSPGQAGINGNAGNYLMLFFKQVRINSATGFGFRFDCMASTGPVMFESTYALNTLGTPGSGYETTNGQFTYVGTASDSNVSGYRVGGATRMFGASSELNSARGIGVVGSGNVQIVGHHSDSDLLPIEISAAAANVQIINPSTSSTVGANSITVASAAVGDNTIHGTNGLDKPINVFPGGVLQQISKSGNLFVGDLKGSRIYTPVNAVEFSANPTFDASKGNTQKITLTGNVTSSTLSNAAAGQQLSFIICQDATGNRTFTWPSNVKGGMTIGSTASTCSAQNFIFDGTHAYAVSAGAVNM